MLNFGFLTSASADEVRAFEDFGINSLWVGGHIASPMVASEAMIQLAQLATLSRRVRIGTSILLLPLYPPAIVAKQIADLDRYSGGRLTLGVGVGGEYPEEFRACGVPLAERGRRTDEAIPLLRRLWSAEELSHPGPLFPMEKVRIHPPPAQGCHVPIIVAGRQEVAMRRAAYLGDGWMPYLYSPRRYRVSVEKIENFAQNRGRSLKNFEWMHLLFTNVHDDYDWARSDTAAFLGDAYKQEFGPVADRGTAVGPPMQVTARVQEFVDAGARHIIFALATHGNRLQMANRIVREVIPLIKVGNAE